MNFFDKLIIDHVLHSPSGVLATVAVLRYLDLGILAVLKYFSAKQADGFIDALAAGLKARVDQDAAQVPPKP